MINDIIFSIFKGEPLNMNSFGVASGAHIIVHNKTENPIFKDGVDAATGSMSNIAINREFISKVASPYSDCTNNIDSDNLFYVKVLADNNQTYSQSKCFLLCYQRYLVEQCKCYDVSIPYWNSDLRACLDLDDFNCIGKNFAYFFSQNVKTVCSSECPLECDSISYAVSVSYSNYPTMAYTNYLKNNSLFRSKFSKDANITYDMLKRNILAVNIFYESLSYKHILELVKTEFVDLISNIGGTLGLFLGTSFLSFVEVIDMFLQVVIYYYYERKANTKKNEIILK